MRKYKNRNLPRGLYIDRGYVCIRIFNNGNTIREHVGPVSQETINDAVDRLNAIRADIRAGKLGLERPTKRIKFKEASSIFFKLHASQLPTAYTYEKYIAVLDNLFGDRYIDTITQDDVLKLRSAIKERNFGGKAAKESTINRYHTVFTSIFNAIKKWGEIGRIEKFQCPALNPGTLVKKTDERQFTRRRVVSPDELTKFMEHATIRIRRICLMAVNTLLRKNDLKKLTISKNINRDTCELVGIHSKTALTSGKPYAQPLNHVVLDVVETANGDKLLDFTNFRREFAQALKDSEVAEFTLKDLRRTGARMLLANGVDIATVSEMLGHTDITTTQKYVGPMDSDRKKASVLLGSIYTYKSGASATERCTSEIDVVSDVVAKDAPSPAGSKSIEAQAETVDLGSVAQG